MLQARLAKGGMVNAFPKKPGRPGCIIASFGMDGGQKRELVLLRARQDRHGQLFLGREVRGTAQEGVHQRGYIICRRQQKFLCMICLWDRTLVSSTIPTTAMLPIYLLIYSVLCLLGHLFDDVDVKGAGSKLSTLLLCPYTSRQLENILGESSN